MNTMDHTLRSTTFPAYPGTPLRRGSTGDDVAAMQYCLESIRVNLYTSLGALTVDGIFGRKTEATVMQYQAIKGLTVDGVIGRNTWDSIVNDYASIPAAEREVYPGTPLTRGSSGPAVLLMQTRLNLCVPVYPAINLLNADGVFGQNTANATRLFQKQFGLTPDEVIGENTWDKIIDVSNSVATANHQAVQTRYVGLVSIGSTGDSVRFVQSYMNRVGRAHTPSFPTVTVDGIFGNATRALVLEFQTRFGLTADGVVGSNTWARMITEFNRIV